MVENRVKKSSIMWMFAGMWLLCIVSAISMKPYVEQYLVAFFALSIISIVGILLLHFIRNVYYSIGISIFSVWVIGATSSLLIEKYVGALGMEVVTVVVVSCVVIFAIVGAIGTFLPYDLSSWGMILFVILMALVVFMIVSIFIPFSSFIMMIVSAIGFLLFVAYTLYDFNMLKNHEFEPYEAPIMALMLFLDLFNMIKFALEFLFHLQDYLGE